MAESNPELRYFKLWLAIGYALMAFIIYVSLTSEPVEIGIDFPFQDKFFHGLAYFSLMGWFAQMFHVKSQRVAFAIAFILMGVILEYMQSFDPARYSETEDMIANILGVAIAVLLARGAVFRNLLVRFERLI
jgi:glycopeptide antibiotics resistance protein